MAIKKIKKMHLLFMKDEINSILEFFQQKNILELKQIDLPEHFKGEFVSSISISDSVQAKSVYLSKLQKSINVLSKYDSEKRTFIEKLNGKIPLTAGQGTTKNIEKLCFEVDKKLYRLDEINLKQIEVAENINEINPWMSVRIAMQEMKDRKWLKIIAGILPVERYDEFCLKYKNSEVVFTEVKRQTKEVYFLASVFVDNFTEIQTEITKFGKIIKWHHLKLSPQQVYQKLKSKLDNYNTRYNKLKNNIQQYTKYLNDLKIEYDKVYNEWMKDLEKERVIDGKYVGVLSGWICEEEVVGLEEDLKKNFKEIYLIAEEPKEDEEPPVAFENSEVVAPFEIITDLYGRPKYSGVDPTPLLTPFFALFFGICLGDAGYGAILTVLSVYFLLVFKNNLLIKKAVKLLLFMGISTTLIGLITGTFFGNIIDFLPTSLDFFKNGLNKLVLIDPLGEKGSLMFLGIALALGYLQLCFGILIKSWMFLKQKDFKGFVLNGLAVFGVQLSLLPLTLYYVLGIQIFQEKIMFGFIILLLVNILIIAYKEWISNEGIFIKLFWCLYGNYTAITGNFLSDTLSYARLFALGLSGGLLGFAINEISSVFRPIPYIGVFVMIVIMILGHLFNLAICFLGAFVHTSRLQYLEFFTKFFESGGRVFKPFRRENKYVSFEE